MIYLLRWLGLAPEATEREAGLLREIDRLEHEIQKLKKELALSQLENEGLAELSERMRTLIVADKAYLSDFAARHGIFPVKAEDKETDQ